MKLQEENLIRRLIREEIDKALFQCHFLISYDINKLNTNLKSKLPEKIKDLGGKMKNESLYCFDGGMEIKSNVLFEIQSLLNQENNSIGETVIYCITADNNKLSFQEIQK